MSNHTHYIVRRNIFNLESWNTLDEAIEAAEKKLKESPSNSFFVYSAERKVEAEQPKIKVEPLYFDWNINYVVKPTTATNTTTRLETAWNQTL